MPYLMVGAGQAGSSIVDDIFGHKNMSQIATPLVFNSTIRDLRNLSNIDRERWYGVADGPGLVPGKTEGFEEKVTGGFGRNPVRAEEVMEGEVDVVEGAIADQLERPVDDEEGRRERADIPFTFLFLGLGGGTGCGIAPFIAEAVEAYTDGKTRIVAVCVLPNTQGPVSVEGDEEATSPSRQAWNARYGLNRLEEVVDGIILVDNQRLSYHEAAEGQFTEYNEYVAGSIVDLISGPALERIDRSEYDVDPPIIDIQDIVTSLSFGVGTTDTEPGYASLGRSVMMTNSLAGYLLPVVGKKQIDAVGLSSLAEMKQTVSDLDPGEAKKAIGLLRAPNRYIANTDYQIDIAKLRSSLASRCDEINLGATLTKRRLASFTTLYTYRRSEVSRLGQIEELAEEYEQNSEVAEA